MRQGLWSDGTQNIPLGAPCSAFSVLDIDCSQQGETCEETIRRYVLALRNAKKGIVDLADHFCVQEDGRDLCQVCRTCELNGKCGYSIKKAPYHAKGIERLTRPRRISIMASPKILVCPMLVAMPM